MRSVADRDDGHLTVEYRQLHRQAGQHPRLFTRVYVVPNGLDGSRLLQCLPGVEPEIGDTAREAFDFHRVLVRWHRVRRCRDHPDLGLSLTLQLLEQRRNRLSWCDFDQLVHGVGAGERAVLISEPDELEPSGLQLLEPAQQERFTGDVHRSDDQPLRRPRRRGDEALGREAAEDRIRLLAREVESLPDFGRTHRARLDQGSVDLLLDGGQPYCFQHRCSPLMPGAVVSGATKVPETGHPRLVHESRHCEYGCATNFPQAANLASSCTRHKRATPCTRYGGGRRGFINTAVPRARSREAVSDRPAFGWRG